MRWEAAGYRTLSAEGAEDARLLVAVAQRIDLLFTDVVLRQWARARAELLALRPQDEGFLYTSGYTDSVIVHHGVLSCGMKFPTKPYTPVSLAQKARSVLGRDLQP